MEYSEDLKKDLERFIYDNRDLEKLEGLLDSFNPFLAFNLTRQEVRHSSFLRWILDPQDTHGLGAYFLRLFLKRLVYKSNADGDLSISLFDVDRWSYTNTQVLQEWQSIDVLIRVDDEQFLVVIENNDTSTLKFLSLKSS